MMLPVSEYWPRILLFNNNLDDIKPFGDCWSTGLTMFCSDLI